MLIVDFIIIFCFSMVIFVNFSYLYQRNFILCDIFLFDSKERTNRCIDKNISCFEKKIAQTDTKIEKGFINDTFMKSSLSYYIIYKTTNTKTLLFFHGNKCSIDRHLDKCFSLHIETDVNILIFDYAGYGKSTGMCENDKDMYWNLVAIYEKVYLNNVILKKNSYIFMEYL